MASIQINEKKNRIYEFRNRSIRNKQRTKLKLQVRPEFNFTETTVENNYEQWD